MKHEINHVEITASLPEAHFGYLVDLCFDGFEKIDSRAKVIKHTFLVVDIMCATSKVLAGTREVYCLDDNE